MCVRAGQTPCRAWGACSRLDSRAVRQGHYVEPADLLKAEGGDKRVKTLRTSIFGNRRIAAVRTDQQPPAVLSAVCKACEARPRQRRRHQRKRVDRTERSIFMRTKPERKPISRTSDAKRLRSLPDEAVSKAQYKLLQSTRNNLLIVGSSPSTLGQITDSLHDVIANRQDCICAYIDLEEMPSDSSVSFAEFFFEIACQITDDANTKFNLGFPMPDPDEYADLDEMNGPAKIAETLKSLRAAIAVHPDAPARLHLVTLFPDLSRLTTAPDSYQTTAETGFLSATSNAWPTQQARNCRSYLPQLPTASKRSSTCQTPAPTSDTSTGSDPDHNKSTTIRQPLKTSGLPGFGKAAHPLRLKYFYCLPARLRSSSSEVSCAGGYGEV